MLRLDGRTYEFNREEFRDSNLPGGTTFGFIAQEIQEVLPEAVSVDNRGFYGINYLAVIPVLAEAIKEQNKKIAELESQMSLLLHKHTIGGCK